jgi:hypothetical protein
MKRLILILNLQFLSSTLILCQNSLYQEGAVWIAAHESNCGIGYEIFEYVGDTTYKENTIKIIERYIITYSYQLADYYEGKKTRDYFMQRGNELYKIIHNFMYIDSIVHGPKLIFDYDAQAGDTIFHLKRIHPKTNAVQVVFYTIIDSLKNEPIDGWYFKTWYGRCYLSNSRLKNTTVIYNEKIGELTQFPLLPRNLSFSKEFPEFPNLVYYTDNTGFEYDPFDEYKNILEMQEKIKNKEGLSNSAQYVPVLEQLSLTPNPANNFIELALPDQYNADELSYEIHKLSCGSKCLSGVFDNLKVRVDISGLESGLYILLVKENNNFRFVERFAKI